MNKPTKRRRAIELAKDVLIVLLSCSALWLGIGSQMTHPLRGALAPLPPQAEAGQGDGGAGIEIARPLRITAVLTEGGQTVRYAAQYDEQASDSLFQQTASLLAEALSEAGEAERATRSQWEAALCSAPGLCFDFQGSIPLPVLSGWLTGEETPLTAPVRRVVLTAGADGASLYFRDEETGAYYRCALEMEGRQELAESLSALSGNGALYAFEAEQYRLLDGDTLLSAQLPTPRVYTAANPAAGGRADLEILMEELGLSPNPNSYYYAGSAHVGRSGNDTLRLLDGGTAVYESEEGSDHFRITAQDGGEPTLLEMVEACRRLTGVLTARCGQSRLFLSSVTQTEEGLEVAFEYSLNGSPVRLDGGSAARFLVADGRIAQFTLRFRSYADSGETSVVMPYVQTMAAMEARGLEGEELLLAYLDNGGERLSASWAALDGGI